jgi:hypothetical protein
MGAEGTPEITCTKAVDTEPDAQAVEMGAKGSETAEVEGAEAPLPPFLIGDPIEGDPSC